MTATQHSWNTWNTWRVVLVTNTVLLRKEMNINLLEFSIPNLNFKCITLMSCSRISQLKIPGLSFLYSSIFFSTSGVATRGLEPPITPGRMDPVSWYRFSILETQPWLTRNCREMTQGRTPAAAISMIFSLMWLGKGRPLIKTPPSWLTRPCPRNMKNGTFNSVFPPLLKLKINSLYYPRKNHGPVDDVELDAAR